MLNNIPNFKIGTNLDDVENFIKQQEGLDQTVLQSIFNFINDDRSFGDGKISNNVELTMINELLSNAMERKNTLSNNGKPSFGINMPEAIQPNDQNVIDSWENENSCTGVTKKVNDNLQETSYHSPTYSQYYAESGNTSDYIDDDNNDGVADGRWVNIENKDGDITLHTQYVDENLDGKFDKKYESSYQQNVKGQTRIEYKRDHEGNWQKVREEKDFF